MSTNDSSIHQTQQAEKTQTTTFTMRIGTFADGPQTPPLYVSASRRPGSFADVDRG